MELSAIGSLKDIFETEKKISKNILYKRNTLNIQGKPRNNYEKYL